MSVWDLFEMIEFDRDGVEWFRRRAAFWAVVLVRENVVMQGVQGEGGDQEED